MDAEESVQAARDPVLVNLGFGADQGGGGDNADIIWCAACPHFQRGFTRCHRQQGRATSARTPVWT